MVHFKYLLIIFALILAGCAINKGTINSFYEPSYQVGSVKSLAVPSVRNARLAPSESQKIGRAVNQAISNKNPNVKLISANDFSNLLNDNKLVNNYADFIEDYVTSGIANREFLEKLKQFEIDAIMISELSNLQQKDGAYGQHAGQTRITLTYTMIDTRTNDVIWTASADGIKGTASTIGEAPPLVEAINLAVEKVKAAVPQL